MTCEFWKLEISALLDGALDARQESEVQRHVSSCNNCRDFYEEHSKLTHFFRESVPALDPPEVLWQKIEKRIATQSPDFEGPTVLESILSWFRVPQVAYGLAAAVLLMVTGLVAIRTQDSTLMESQYIAALEAYSIEVNENPFLSNTSSENPFFELDDAEPVNPFRSGEFPK